MTRVRLIAVCLLVLCGLPQQAQAVQGEHARRAAAELRLVLGDATLLAGGQGLSPRHLKGLRERIAGSLSALGILMRLADQETGRAPRNAPDLLRAMRSRHAAGDWENLANAASGLVTAYPLPIPRVSVSASRAKTLHGDLCAGCHDDPDLETERPAWNLFEQARRLPADEFYARMIIGVRGDRVTGFSNPLSDGELMALIKLYAGSPP